MVQMSLRRAVLKVVEQMAYRDVELKSEPNHESDYCSSSTQLQDAL